MAQNKNATNSQAMGGLHKLVTVVLSTQLKEKVKLPILDYDNEVVLGEDGEPLYEEQFSATPQLLNAAITFLKNNNIESFENAAEVGSAKDELEERRKANRERIERIRQAKGQD